MILKIINKLTSDFEKGVIAIGMIALAFIVFMNVATRFFLHWSWIGEEEVSKLIVIWVTFLGTSWAARKGLHISMSALFDNLPTGIRKALYLVIALITAAFCFMLAFLGWQLTYFAWETEHVSSALMIPIWIFYLAIPLGIFLTGIQYTRVFFENLRQKELCIGPEPGEEEK